MRFWLFLLIFPMIFVYNLQSEEEHALEVDLTTPYGAIFTHIRFLQPDNLDLEKAAAPFMHSGINLSEAQTYAKKMLKILDGRQLYVIMKQIPAESDYVDSVSGESKYILFPNEPWIFLQKSGDKWLYSKQTIEKIPEEFAKTYPFNLNKITDYLPDFMMRHIIGIAIWQWLGIVLFMIIGIFVFYIFYWIFGYFLTKIFLKYAKKEILANYIASISKPLSLLAVLLLFIAFLGVLQLPIQIGYYAKFGLKVLYPVVITIIIYRLSDLASDIFERIAMKTSSTIDDHLVPLVRKTIKIIIVAFGVIYIINNMGVDITPLIAGASIGGLAIALAAKDTLSNFFGSITIFTDQPFEVGDWIVFSGIEGTVEEVGVRSTRIRTFYNSQISVPNGKLADAVIDNMGRREYRRFIAKIGLTYDTPPDAFDAFVDGLKAIVDNHPDTRKDYYQIHLNEFGDSSIIVLFYVFFKVDDWTQELDAKHEVMNEIIKLANALGVRFAFPTQTLHIEEVPGQASLTPNFTQSRDDFMSIKNQFAENQKFRWSERNARGLQ